VAAIPDKGGKVRVIALGSYPVQTVNKPFHDLVYRWLKRLPQDMTHDQGGFVEQVRKWGRVPLLSSLDLTNATDRFPIDFIGDLFEPILGKTFVSNWKTMLTGAPFTYKGPGGSSQEVSFSVGTPLGFYGSWGPFAMAVHFIQWMVLKDLGRPKPLEGRYCVLGDDYLAGDEDLAKGYRDWLERKLGVSISQSKTSESPHYCQFAKRDLFWTDSPVGLIEISPFPISSIWNTEASAPLLVASLHGEMKKGLSPRSGVPGAIKDLDERLYTFYKSFSTFSPKRARIRGRAARQCDAVMGLVKGTKSADDCVTTILSGLRPDDAPWAPDEALHLVRSACALLYRRSLKVGDRAVISSAFVEELATPILHLYDSATPSKVTGEWPLPETDLAPMPVLGWETSVEDLLLAQRAMETIPILAVFNRLESGMVLDLEVLGDGDRPLEGWPGFVRAVQLGVTGLDPRIPEEAKRVVASSLLAKAIVDLYTGKEVLPPRKEGEAFDAWVFLLGSKVPMPFTEFRLQQGWMPPS
jgi:hypothetical protein